MNYFGLFFSFMIPGIVMGIMATVVMMESTQRKKNRSRRESMPAQHVSGRKLYVHSMQ